LKSYIALGIWRGEGAGNGRGVATFGAEHATHACDGTQILTLPVGTGIESGSELSRVLSRLENYLLDQT